MEQKQKAYYNHYKNPINLVSPYIWILWQTFLDPYTKDHIMTQGRLNGEVLFPTEGFILNNNRRKPLSKSAQLG